MSDGQWTSDPPEREGWYWVRQYEDVEPDPVRFVLRSEGWAFWDSVSGPPIYEAHWWDWEWWSDMGYQRSVEPLTPKEPPK